MITLIQNATSYLERIALRSDGINYTYEQILNSSEGIALELLAGRQHLEEERIAFLVPPGFDYVAIQWAIWRAGGIAVPLCVKHPLASIKYVIEDTEASIIVYSEEFESLLAPLKTITGIRFMVSEKFMGRQGLLPDISLDQRAMILYTSGTTGNPKGVVTTHRNLEAQITSLTTSWEWNQDDHILNVLPLHHVHGIVNVLSCALWSGACCQFLAKFDADEIFEVFCKNEVNVFMAVPTIFYKLISNWNELSEEKQQKISNALKDFRLMVSGSAALPISVLENWRHLSGHILLERYGMTEMGMAISNPYHGERKPGFIGQALSGVQIRLADEDNNSVGENAPGEIQIKGLNVFKEYWNKAEATKGAFTADGWFKSGDIAISENASYRILGRKSVDIIKSGGYKISALEIEEVLRSYDQIKDCAVVGIPDDEWGEIIGASLILGSNEFNLDQLKEWLKENLPVYKFPRKYIFQEELPRNVMGKVTKNELKKMF
ncbi:MAG: acyl-CoA synthetase [Cyclobacteriaceae bacterium]|jgi:malonyl-CoA/methylmalonyl-CoA synthetase|nr:acyl-CoA synthetase [Cyclobacteriaceae bacterium]